MILALALIALSFANRAHADANRPIDYLDVVPIFQERCSACHNPHIAKRNGLVDWSVRAQAEERRGAIRSFVIETEMMPKKWSEKFSAWSDDERRLFKGWVESKSFFEAGLSTTVQLKSSVAWRNVTESEIDELFTRKNCRFCTQMKSQMDGGNRLELGNTLYWGLFYLGNPPADSKERKNFLSWSFEELVVAASWLRQLGVEVSPQWIHVRSNLVKK